MHPRREGAIAPGLDTYGHLTRCAALVTVMSESRRGPKCFPSSVLTNAVVEGLDKDDVDVNRLYDWARVVRDSCAHQIQNVPNPANPAYLWVKKLYDVLCRTNR